MVVLIVEPDPDDARSLTACVQELGYKPITTDGVKSASRVIRDEALGLILMGTNGHLDGVLRFMEVVQSLQSQPPVIVMSHKASLEDAVEIMRVGAHDFWVKPVQKDRLCKTIEWLNAKSKESPAQASPADSHAIITGNAAMMHLKTIARRVAPTNAAVFLQGESGTGKEVFARYIHLNSERRNRPFFALNCAALPESLVESELFGHEKGAFTGAIKAREGKFELAHTSTLFLDEITEIPIHLQSKLLRVLQENEVDRIGGKYPVEIDVRVIASTNVVIEEALKAGRFRKDLYYRLNVIPLKIPPLRERREDIAMLSGHFIEKYRRLHNCTAEEITPEAVRAMQSYHWPGNVRELENVIQRAVLLSQDRKLTPEHLIFDDDSFFSQSGIELMPIDEMEKILIHKALATFDGNRTRAAEILGISVRTLRNKLHQYEQN